MFIDPTNTCQAHLWPRCRALAVHSRPHFPELPAVAETRESVSVEADVASGCGFSGSRETGASKAEDAASEAELILSMAAALMVSRRGRCVLTQ